MCQQCVENASMNMNGECVCENGFEQMTGVSGVSGCLEVPALANITCMDELCLLCPEGMEGCRECAKNASMGENGVCACNAGFVEMMSLNGFGCIQTREGSEQPAPPTTTTPTMPSSGLSVRPQAGSGARDPQSEVTVTPVLNEKIQALADKVRAATRSLSLSLALSMGSRLTRSLPRPPVWHRSRG